MAGGRWQVAGGSLDEKKFFTTMNESSFLLRLRVPASPRPRVLSSPRPVVYFQIRSLPTGGTPPPTKERNFCQILFPPSFLPFFLSSLLPVACCLLPRVSEETPRKERCIVSFLTLFHALGYPRRAALSGKQGIQHCS
ncbi:MAG: hypothetical protein F6K31_17225 [Symploca sp. SIO2G7]|nr:hypothetical protein [Symploca sp. SIO2G7]